MSTGDGFGHRWGRNGEFCVAVGHVTSTAGIYQLIVCQLVGSKVEGDKLSSIATDLTILYE